ncbi:uncharacterized protein [Aristolochia californica]|uniref:uncharacterized protein n=1 Tax=Aristolochia californica TaxID=171875 RepID=UPI0035DABC60
MLEEKCLFWHHFRFFYLLVLLHLLENLVHYSLRHYKDTRLFWRSLLLGKMRCHRLLMKHYQMEKACLGTKGKLRKRNVLAVMFLNSEKLLPSMLCRSVQIINGMYLLS